MLFVSIAFSASIMGSMAIDILMVSNKGITVYNTSAAQRAELMAENEMTMKEVDYHLARREVYAMTSRQILRCPLSMESSREYHPVVYSEDEYSFMSMAVDWVRDALYWTCGPALTIHRARLDGSERQVVYKGYYLDHTHKKLLIDPHAGLLFWATSSQIYTADLEGSEVRQLQFPEVLGEHRSRVKSLALDPARRRLYFLAGFVDDDVWLMMSGGYDGSGFRRHGAVSKHTYAIAALADTVYWIAREPGLTTHEPGGRQHPYTLVLYAGDAIAGVRTTERVMDLNSGSAWNMKICHEEFQKPALNVSS